ncbi:glutathione peroxidase [Paraburkholderia sacchari]|uniref:Glutathione peroxidase n=1 Tax=Paraburkholderia sacchari TaxID=159450 RepID=A0A8T6ZJR7_9BURK|nr:glutathione peroxidase [Paraburkholderia sacchari]NLP64905.1 glutathione peroxidase [Paraburkholderia sacchari]
MATALHDISFTTMGGSHTTLAAYRGKVLLLVNVASRCGLTPQYSALETLYRLKKSQGFEVLAFPANDFKEQEPGTNQEIFEFCTTNYGVSFPIFSKISVVGPNRHPLYAELTALRPVRTGEGPFMSLLEGYGISPSRPDDILWNFEKFLISRDGAVVERFAPDVTADDSRLIVALDRELERL